MTIRFEDFRDALEAVNELLAERSWHKNEPRCGYQKNYERLEQLAARLDKQFQSQLPTIEEVQQAYRAAKGEDRPNV